MLLSQDREVCQRVEAAEQPTSRFAGSPINQQEGTMCQTGGKRRGGHSHGWLVSRGVWIGVRGALVKTLSKFNFGAKGSGEMYALDWLEL